MNGEVVVGQQLGGALGPFDQTDALAAPGFLQADPIRAPARAQDLTLRHRVKDYRAGDLERRYPRLPIQEDFFVNYGFVSNDIQQLMHPRTSKTAWSAATRKRAVDLLDFIRERGEVHPREVDAYFAHGQVTNDWGGSSSATTHLLNGMHYRGLVRVVRRDSGTRIYAAHEHPPKPGDKATLNVWRDGKKQDLAVTVGRLEADKTAEATSPRNEKADTGKLGLAVRPSKEGLVVETVSGPAARAGIQAGDVVTAVNGKPVKSVDDLRKAAGQAKGSVAVLVRRGEDSIFVPIEVG